MKRIFRGQTYANVTATVALIVALGGTSYAAVKLPRNSVTSATVKDRSLLRQDFRPGQIPSAKQAPAGADGSAVVLSRAEAPEPLVPGTAPQTIQTLSLPAGNWAVTSKFIAENAGNDGFMACTLSVGGVPVDSLGAGNGTDFGTGDGANALVGAGSLPSGGSATVVCTTNNTVSAGTYRAKSIVAVRASALTPG